MILSKAVNGFVLALVSDGYSSDTIDNYRRFMTKIATLLGDPPLEDITEAKLRNVFTSLRQQGLSASSLQVYWKVMRSFYNWGERDLGIKRPDSAIRSPRFVSKEVLPFTKDEIDRLLKAATSRRNRALMLVMLDTGLRVSELARLEMRDLNLEEGTLAVRPFQTGLKSKARLVFMGKSSRKALWTYLTEREGAGSTSPLFSTIQGAPLNRTSIRNIVLRIGERAQVTGVTPHRFRHTFAIEYLRGSGDIFSLQRILGHSSLEMVKRYLHLVDDDAKSAHQKASPVDRFRL
jgi:integrase/recombinase XerD